MKDRWVCLTVLAFLFIGLPGPSWAGQDNGAVHEAVPAVQAVRAHIGHANAYYWLGIVEKGDLAAFGEGLKQLDQAAKQLHVASLPPEAKERLGREIGTLKADMESQIKVHEGHFYAAFPLVRVLERSPFKRSQAAGTFEMMDDPDQAAVNSAGRALRDDVVGKWTARPQLPVVLTSVPSNNEIENQLAYLFSLSSRFSVNSSWEVMKALSREQWDSFREGGITRDVGKRFCSGLDVRDLLMVTARKLDEVDGNHFHSLEGRIYNAARDEWTLTFSQMGFSRDRRERFWPIVCANALLFFFALALYPILARYEAGAWPPLSSALVIPAAGFALGRMMPWLLLPMVFSVVPSEDSFAVLSLWWPGLLGIALFIVPAVFYVLASGRLASSTSPWDMSTRGGAVCTTIAMGVCAFLAAPLFLASQTRLMPIPFLVLLALGSGMALYVFGRVFDSRYPLTPWAALGSSAAVALLGPALLHLDFIPLLLCTLGIVAGLPAFLALSAHKRASTESGFHPSLERKVPNDARDLLKHPEVPCYEKIEGYDGIVEKLAPVKDGYTVWLQLKGPPGIGRTATARALIRDLTMSLEGDGKRLVLLKGQCAQAGGGPVPYAPFQLPLAKHFGLNAQGAFSPQRRQMTELLGEVVKTVIPFPLALPSLDSTVNQPGSQREVFQLYADTYGQLSRGAAVVLFIDDAHWMDQPSRELLDFLLRQFPPGGRAPILLLLSSRDAGPAAREMGPFTIELKAPDREERARILCSRFFLKPDVAERIVDKVAGSKSNKEGMSLLFQVVYTLADKGFFRRTEEGFEWSAENAEGQNLPIPDKLRTILDDLWRKYPKYQKVLECAACLAQGLEFSVKHLADCLEMPVIELLHTLAAIEDKTGIVHDDLQHDDFFSFDSPLMLEAIREKAGITMQGPKAENVRQIIREYHARAAAHLEKSLPRSPLNVFELARQYYAAGAGRAHKALEYCLKASEACKREFLHAEAVEFIRMAGECSEKLGRPFPMEEELLLIECDRSRVLGSGRRETVDRVLDYLKRHPDPPLRVLPSLAGVLHEAGREDESLREETARLGRMMAESTDASPVQKAEGLYYVGVSLAKDLWAERESALREALHLAESCPEDDLHAQSLLVRIADALADELGRPGSAEASPEAGGEIERLHELSRAMRQRLQRSRAS